MCFGSKDSTADAPARPVQLQQSNPADNKKAAYPPPARRSNEYAPPAGPPPGRQNNQQNQSNDYAPPAGPPPGRQQNNDYEAPAGPPPGRRNDYEAPSGPPPRRHDEYEAPSGPPPGRAAADDFAPPPGPPPGQASRLTDGPSDDFAPPAGPPPSYGVRYNSSSANDYAPPPGPPPKVHDWEAAVPDNSLLPPPPSLFAGWDRSPVNNATEDEANAGIAWCKTYPIDPRNNVPANDDTRNAINNYRFNLQKPISYRGSLDRQADGSWKGSTDRKSPDTCLISFPPVYAANLHQPRVPGGQKTVYYEVHIARNNRNEVSLAMGFAAMPYPHFRLPGWHRGSLAVHGDDGHRYVNDMWGGKELIDGNYRLKPGGKYGIGMVFTRKDGPPAYEGAAAKDQFDVEVFFTDNGRKVASWDLHEETDAEQDLPVVGLEGDYDLSAAIGTFEAVKFEVIFDKKRHAYKIIE